MPKLLSKEIATDGLEELEMPLQEKFVKELVPMTLLTIGLVPTQ